ncbi:MAG: ribosome silencing factor [Parachlamydiaceae bacterium]
MTKEDQYKLNLLSQTIFDKKGVNILALDVRNISTMADYFLIAEGSVGRHVKAIAQAIKQKMNEDGVSLLRGDGEKDGEWVVLDYGDIVIHLLTPDMREKYALEELWNKSKIVDVDIIIGF